ncbi:uncharacterized protein LOC119685542 [Teleopsis dalmanni]|uniref:uncharacterized protein LOC119685542 n=1 Tax=Teleopsis dalmanni TaxID=139649 RepID=UPI0018CCD582|nr:uncharacterized protein LOC119685542 [Teleopsis dalmanni]
MRDSLLGRQRSNSACESSKLGDSTPTFNKISEPEIKDLQQKVIDLQVLCQQLKKENERLKTENANLKTEKDSNSLPTSCSVEKSQEYVTDEEELAKETDWILKKSRPNKKRRAESSPEVITQAKNVEKTEPNKRSELRPPPIVISNVNQYQELQSTIEKNVKNKFSIRLLGNGTQKINVFDGDDYRSVTKSLSNSNFNWFSYENKQIRPIRVIVKNLHHSCEEESIVSDLQQQGFNALSAKNKLKQKTKEPLDIFLLTFEHNEDINKIFGIKHILHSIVKIEAVKSPKLIPQYANEQPKCCNCGENHPANYRGCVAAIELEKIRNKRISNQEQNKELLSKPKPLSTHTTNKKQNVSYAQAVKSNGKVSYASNMEPIATSSTNKQNEDVLTQILHKLQKQEVVANAIQVRLTKLEQKLNENSKNKK